MTVRWERSEAELEGTYQSLVAPRVPFLQVVSATGMLALFVGAVWAFEPRLTGYPSAWLGGGVWAMVTYFAVRGPWLRARARVLRRRLEARGLGLPREIEVRREPWGITVTSEDGRVEAAWAALPTEPDGEFWIGPGFILPDRAGMAELLARPHDPPPLPDPPPGTVEWTYERAARAATARANHAVDWRTTVVTSVVMSFALALPLGLELARGGLSSEVTAFAVAVLGWRVVAHLLDAWQWRRARRFARPIESRVDASGIGSGVPGLLRTSTPWSRIRRRRTIDKFTFFQGASGEWHIVPSEIVPDDVGRWLREGQEARRRGSVAAKPEVDRANPFEPPA